VAEVWGWGVGGEGLLVTLCQSEDTRRILM